LPVKYHEVKGRYLDSILLMSISRDLEKREGVRKAGVMVMTKENRETFRDIGFEPPPETKTSSIWIAVEAESDEVADEAVKAALEAIDRGQATGPKEERVTLDTLKEYYGKDDFPVLFISTPAEYVEGITDTALDQGVNVHIFTSNVPVETERRLKEKARGKGLLVMGPDAGTTIIHGMGLGFANRVRFGDIGIVGSSGTGIQELSVLLDKGGLGLSSAIGVGSNDLKKGIGAISTLQAIEALGDIGTVIVIAKKPDPGVCTKVIERIRSRPSVFISLGDSVDEQVGKTYHTGYIDEAVNHVLREQGKKEIPVEKQKPATPGGRKWLRGFFAGGSLCYQAQAILKAREIEVFSNAPLDDLHRLPSRWENLHVCIDTGAEEYVRGKPHPMIDPKARNALIVKESARSDVAALLFDIILGYGSAMDPLDGLFGVRKGPVLVTSICGTLEDKQGYTKIKGELEALGVKVLISSGQAAMYAAGLVKG
jgi:FdrA protein